MANPTDPAPASSEVPVATIEHDNSQLEDFVEENRTKLLLGVAAVLVIIIGYLGVKYIQESSAAEAAGAFTGAETMEELQEVVRDFPNGVVAGSAELLIIEQLYAQEKTDEADAALEAFVATRKDHPLYFKGVSDLGLREHLKGNLDAAVARLKEASAAGAAPGFIAQPALLRLGDALMAKGLAAMANNDVETAKSHFSEAQLAYEDLATRAGENTYLNRIATQRKERLPHLSIPPLTPAEAEAAAAAEENAAPPVTEIPPIDEIDLSSEGSTALPPADIVPPDEATLPPSDDSAGDDGNN